MDRTRRRRKLHMHIAAAAACLVILLFVAVESGCTSFRTRGVIRARKMSAQPDEVAPGHLSVEAAAIIARHHAQGKGPGAKVLDAALGLLEDGTVVVGSCWDYVNRAYDDAGYGSKKRAVVWKEPEQGPYIEPTLVRPGDWIMFRNLTFGNIGHSSIFVEWLDIEKRSALTIEYAGQNRKIPGRFREYDITKCYCVLRGSE